MDDRLVDLSRLRLRREPEDVSSANQGHPSVRINVILSGSASSNPFAFELLQAAVSGTARHVKNVSDIVRHATTAWVPSPELGIPSGMRRSPQSLRYDPLEIYNGGPAGGDSQRTWADPNRGA